MSTDDRAWAVVREMKRCGYNDPRSEDQTQAFIANAITLAIQQERLQILKTVLGLLDALEAAEADRDDCLRKYGELFEANAGVVSERDRLREALRPFAKAASGHFESSADCRVDLAITLGECRRARAALDATKEKPC